jgi:hypothetical protein
VTLAFSANAGDPCDDFLPQHPLWEKIRTAKYSCCMNLLPIVNIGLVNQGEGLWPILSLDKISLYLERCKPGRFSGAVIVTSHTPREDAILSCSLWTASQVLWGNGEGGLLAETWFKAYRPDLYQHPGWQTLLREMREVAINIGLLRSLLKEKRGDIAKEEFRILTDSILSRLKCLFAKINNLKSNGSERPNLKEYFSYFYRDARRLILRFLQHYQMPLLGVLDGDDMKPSFWTEISNANSQGITSGVNVVLLEEPRKGDPQSQMTKIYEEVFH